MDGLTPHSGGGTVSVTDFFVTNFGKLYRSCGVCIHHKYLFFPATDISQNCSTMYKRTFTATGVVAEDGDVLVGINSNYGGLAP